jgi:SsrA-binding protein
VQENINIQNKKAKFKYFIEKKYIAGLVLTGLQIKSIRYKKANIDNSYCTFDSDELFLYNTNFENNLKSNTIKLLLNKKELIKIKKETNSPGVTIIPLKIFINDNGFAKVQICIAKGKRNFDKRETIKKREAKVKISRILKRN